MARPPAKRSRSKARKTSVMPRMTRLLSLIMVLLIAFVSAPFLPSSLIASLPGPVQQSIQRVQTSLMAWVTAKTGGVISQVSPPLSPVPPAKPSAQVSLTPGAKPVTQDLPHAPSSFSAAKKAVYDKVYFDHRVTFYCGCQYNAKKDVALDTCGLQSLSGISRAKRIEAEHVFPAAQFGNFRKCWREPESFPECVTSKGRHRSGRECCERVDSVFKTAHNDLHNLYPEDGYINGQRSDFNWGMVNGGERFGDCDIRVDASIRRVQPPAKVRGDIARTMLYMADTYGFRLSRQDEQLYRAWNNADPPDTWEIERDHRIKQIEGVGNRYVEEYRRLE
jgi:deoxyribonuclease I